MGFFGHQLWLKGTLGIFATLKHMDGIKMISFPKLIRLNVKPTFSSFWNCFTTYKNKTQTKKSQKSSAVQV